MTKNGEKSRKSKGNFCEFCNTIVIGSTFKFKSHLFGHDAVKPRFVCKYCLKEYFRRDTYTRHMKSHSGKNYFKKKLICDYCGRDFVNKQNLIVHLKKIHDEPINPNYVGFTCRACSTVFCEKRLLDNHIRKHHFNVEVNDEPSHFNRDLNEKWIEKVESTNACVEMTKIKNNMITIKKLENFDSLAEFEKEVKSKKSAYGSHIVDQYSKAICDYCKREMTKKSLRGHIREVHLNIRRYSCFECSRTFKRHYLFVDHKCNKVRFRE